VAALAQAQHPGEQELLSFGFTASVSGRSASTLLERVRVDAYGLLVGKERLALPARRRNPLVRCGQLDARRREEGLQLRKRRDPKERPHDAQDLQSVDEAAA
jgi:hypothetical protein